MKKHVHGPDCSHQQIISRRVFREYIMPKVGDMINGNLVTYVHQTQMWCTVLGKGTMNDKIELDNKIFQITHVNESAGRYNLQFIGYKENPAPAEAPVENTDDVIKVI